MAALDGEVAASDFFVNGYCINVVDVFECYAASFDYESSAFDVAVFDGHCLVDCVGVVFIYFDFYCAQVERAIFLRFADGLLERFRAGICSAVSAAFVASAVSIACV